MPLFRNLIKYALQPLILISTVTAWVSFPESPAVYPLTIIVVQLLLGTMEHWLPARPAWVIHAKEKCLNILIVVFLLAGTIMVTSLYDQFIVEPLGHIRESLDLDIWPRDWPLVIQMFMVFFLSEFIWYWIHRAEHRWYLIWRLSGHGAHHSFKRLGALNFGLNHPLELFFLAVPAAIVELLFGVGVAAAGALVLLTTQASIAHTNLEMNSRWIDFIFTTNRHHLRHHSVVLEESNTNYGCSVLLWDRLFGTFEDGTVVECGIGPSEPSLTEKLMMPIREPTDTAIAPA